MNEHKRSFLDLSTKVNALKFGSFTLKSGRISPYFFNAGAFNSGPVLAKLGALYAECLLSHTIPCDHLFGPAYKGIPLATAVGIALNERQRNATLTFNRKEAKSHGEGGQLFGAPLHGNTVIIDDVISAGTAFREAEQQIQAAGAKISGIVIALDRCEKGQGNHSAIDDIRNQGIQVASIATLYDVLDYLQMQQRHNEVKTIETYLETYGV